MSGPRRGFLRYSAPLPDPDEIVGAGALRCVPRGGLSRPGDPLPAPERLPVGWA